MLRILYFYNKLKIANKLKFLTITSAIVSGVIMISLLYVFQYINEREMAVKEAKVFANILAENIATSIISGNLGAISNTLATVEYNDKISKTFALDNSWKMLGAFHKGNDFIHQKEMIPIIRKNQNLWQDGYFYSVVSILSDENKIGNLVVVVSLDDFHFQMLQSSLVIIFIVFISVLVTSQFRKLLQNSILIPISQLDYVTSKIIKTKDLTQEIKIVNHDEIGSLASKFKNMLYELNTYHKELTSQKDILAYQSTHDSLTNLPNRVLFHERLSQSISKSKRNDEKFALFFIDLDQFKEINDTFGHDYGDKLLVEVSKRFQSVIRADDTLARLGGDEFTVIMNNVKEYHTSSILAQKLLDILTLPLELNNEFIVMGCSIGISLYPKDAISSEELIKNADVAMYRSKENGRKTYHFYEEEMMQKVMTRVSMQAKIRKALDLKEFTVYYQPQYDLETRTIKGFEALVRWFDSNGKIIYPNQFIPLAEEVGLVVGINHQVMKMAMIQAKTWYDMALNPGRISINISIEQLEDINFVSFIQQLLINTQCQAKWIMLELTESQLMKNPDLVISTIKELSKLDFHISIDDFGTGYSSLAYLKHLAVNELKIDRSFISELPYNYDDVAIVKAIIALASSLSIKLIAEGIETKEQEEFLIAHECYNVQGYFYAKPLVVEEATKLLLSEKVTDETSDL